MPLPLIGPVLSRISVSHKLLLIYALDMVTVAFLGFTVMQEAYISIDFARKEQIGTSYVAVVRDALFDALQYAGRTESDPSENGLAPQISALDEMESRFGEGLETKQSEEAVVTSLRQLARRDGSSSDNIAQTVSTSRELMSRIGDSSNLILDPDLDSYYAMSLVLLRMPELLEIFVHLRSELHDAVLAGRLDNDRRGAILVLEGRLATVSRGLSDDFDAGIRGNPDGSLRRVLRSGYADLLGSIVLLTNELGQFDTAALVRPEQIQQLDGRILGIEHLSHSVWKQTAEELGRLLNQRIDGFFSRMYHHFELAGGLLAVILFLVLFVARSIARPIVHLAEVADRVRQTSDYTLRARWTSQDEAGRLVLAFNTMLERLQAEGLLQQELAARARAAEAQRDLLAAIPLPLIVMRLSDQALLNVNQPASQLLGIASLYKGMESRSGFGVATIGSASDWLSEHDRSRLLAQVDAGGEVTEFEAECRSAGGERLWTLMSARPLVFENEPAVLLTIVPINERRQMEEELRGAKDHAEKTLSDLREAQLSLIQAEKLASLGGLVGGIAHEINTPVGIGLTGASALMAETQRIHKHYTEDDLDQAAFEDYLQIALTTTKLLVSNMDRAAALIQSFKLVAVDQVSAERRRFDLDQYLEEVLTSLRPTFRKGRTEVTVDCPPNLEIDSFPGALSQILTNLVMNAITHAFEGREEGRISITVEQPSEKEVRIRFVDDGIGIPPEHLGRIFDPFFTTKRGSGGSGLGLHIVFNLVTGTLQGRIVVTSTLGVGTSFALSFPRSAAVIGSVSPPGESFGPREAETERVMNFPLGIAD